MAIHDNTAVFNIPVAVKWISAVTVGVHIGRLFVVPEDAEYSLLSKMAFIPGRYSDAYVDIYGWGWHQFLTPITYLLAHADITHLLINVSLFLAFGAAIGRQMGVIHFLMFYMLCGLAGAFGFWLFNSNLFAPVIGASGAVAGMVGAVCRLGLKSSRQNNEMPFNNKGAAYSFVVVWLILNLSFSILPIEVFGVEVGRIAWETHLGGFLFGFVTITWFDGARLSPVKF